MKRVFSDFFMKNTSVTQVKGFDFLRHSIILDFLETQ